MSPGNTVNDWAIVIATLMGPLFAVQVQVWLERRRATRDRRQRVFYALMRTRSSNVAPEHVHALNAVPIEFYRVKTITDAYKDYIAHLNAFAQTDAWGQRRVDLFMDLLHKISQELDYKFTVAQLKGEYYAPKWQFDLEAEQTAIRQGIANVLAGKAALPMDVKSFPVDQQMRGALKAVLEGQQAIKTKDSTPQTGLEN
jgi:hypothetical protein